MWQRPPMYSMALMGHAMALGTSHERCAACVVSDILKCKKCKNAKFAIKNAFITLQKQNRRTLRGTCTLQ